MFIKCPDQAVMEYVKSYLELFHAQMVSINYRFDRFLRLYTLYESNTPPSDSYILVFRSNLMNPTGYKNKKLAEELHFWETSKV